MTMADIEQVPLRQALAEHAGGVTVVTCLADGQDHAMTANAFTSVSLDPPLVLVCVAKTARFATAISVAEHWGVSVLAEEALPDAQWLATSGRPLAGQLDQVPHHRSSAGYALLDRARAWLECRTEQVADAGDHHVIVGAVLQASRVTGSTGDSLSGPLVYWHSDYHSVRTASAE